MPYKPLKGRLLVVSPHFPPIDAVDMHRVRMNVRHYCEAGWRTTVLAITPNAAGRLVDHRLEATIPSEVDVERVGAIPTALARWAGISAIGLRGYLSLARGGDRLIAAAARDGRPFHLVFISTTAFPVMGLGRRWRRKFGLPYVLDMQDPWFTTPSESKHVHSHGIKHRLMRTFHGWLEAKTVPTASGIIAVSSRYIESLHAAFPALRNRPAETIPFGWSAADIMQARIHGRPWLEIYESKCQKKITAISAGRIGPKFGMALRSFFSIIRSAPRESILGKIRICFLGTGYMQAGNKLEVLPPAQQAGVIDRVCERPDRLPIFDALASLDAADILIIFGSDDLAYQPSKLHQCLALAKPILIVAPSASRIAHQTKGLAGVVFIEANERAATADEISAAEASLRVAIALPEEGFRDRLRAVSQYESAIIAQCECALFEKAVAELNEHND